MGKLIRKNEAYLNILRLRRNSPILLVKNKCGLIAQRDPSPQITTVNNRTPISLQITKQPTPSTSDAFPNHHRGRLLIISTMRAPALFSNNAGRFLTSVLCITLQFFGFISAGGGCLFVVLFVLLYSRNKTGLQINATGATMHIFFSSNFYLLDWDYIGAGGTAGVDLSFWIWAKWVGIDFYTCLPTLKIWNESRLSC